MKIALPLDKYFLPWGMELKKGAAIELQITTTPGKPGPEMELGLLFTAPEEPEPLVYIFAAIDWPDMPIATAAEWREISTLIEQKDEEFHAAYAACVLPRLLDPFKIILDRVEGGRYIGATIGIAAAAEVITAERFIHHPGEEAELTSLLPYFNFDPVVFPVPQPQRPQK